jgi:hypothetical protein
MRATPRPIALLLASLALALASAELGCYKPNITDWSLKCNMDAGAKACPDGFKCDLATHLCYQNPDAAPDRPDVSPDTSNMDGSMEERPPICFDAMPACTPGSGMCDPFCQTGCGCEEKCSVNTAGALTCNPLVAGQRRYLGEPCSLTSRDTLDQTDACVPGLVCLEDACGVGIGGGRCYQFCRTDNDCVNAPCNRDVGGGYMVCDVPYDECVPLGTPNNTGCMGLALGCWLSTSDPRKTICDCQFPPGRGQDDLCTRSRECNPGLVCVERGGLGFKQCTRVCRLAVPSDCNGTCRTYMEAGISNSTYGFCL